MKFYNLKSGPENQSRGLSSLKPKCAEKIERIEKVKTVIKETKELTPNLEERVLQLEQILGQMIFANHKVWADFLPKPETVVTHDLGLLSEEEIASLAASIRN